MGLSMECREKPHPHYLLFPQPLCPSRPLASSQPDTDTHAQARALARSGGGVGAVGSSSLGYSIGSQSRSSGVSQVGWHLPSLLHASEFGTLVLPRGGACGECTRDSLELQEVAGPTGICLTTLA